MYEAELVQNMKECTLNIFGADPEKLASQMNPLLRNSLTTFGILCSKLCPSPEIQESESLQDQVHLTATSINWTAANIDRWWSAMDFSGWGRHAFMPCRSACYLRDLLLDVGSLMHNAWFVREHVTLAFFLDPRLPKHVVGLDACVTQMILTLVHNACDCTFEGVVNVELTEGAAFNHCRSLHVKVTDTGIGVNQQCIPYLFDKCFSTKEGTGINLFVLKHQAAALMGTYGWNRRTGEELIDKKYQDPGAVFWFQVPLEVGPLRTARSPGMQRHFPPQTAEEPSGAGGPAGRLPQQESVGDAWVDSAPAYARGVTANARALASEMRDGTSQGLQNGLELVLAYKATEEQIKAMDALYNTENNSEENSREENNNTGSNSEANGNAENSNADNSINLI